MPLAILQSKLPEPNEHKHYRQMVEEAKIMALGEMLTHAFFKRVQNTACLLDGPPKPEFRVIRMSLLLI